MRANLDVALTALGLPHDYALVDLHALPRSDERTGYPMQTLLVQNRDLFAMPDPTPPFPQPT